MGAMCHGHHHHSHHSHHHHHHGHGEGGGSGGLVLVLLCVSLTLLLIPYLLFGGASESAPSPCIACAIVGPAQPSSGGGPSIVILVLSLASIGILIVLHLLPQLDGHGPPNCGGHGHRHGGHFNMCTGNFVASSTPHARNPDPPSLLPCDNASFSLPSEPALFLWGLLGMFFFLMAIHYSLS